MRKRTPRAASRVAIALMLVMNAQDVAGLTAQDRQAICAQLMDYLRQDLAFGLTLTLRTGTPYRGGTTHVVFEPLDFSARRPSGTVP